MALLTWAGWLVVATVVVGLGAMVAANAGGLYGLALPLLCGGVVCLVLAWRRERRAKGEVRLRHCLECGASVSEDAAVCPRCRSVRLESRTSDGPQAGVPRGAPNPGREMPVSAYSSDASGVIGWVDAAPPGSYSAADGVTPRSLRRWGMALLGLGALLIAAGALPPM